MKRVVRFLRKYKMLNLAIAGLIAGGILEFFGYSTVAHWLLGIIVILGCMPLLTSMWKDIRHGSYGIDILGLTTIITALLLHKYWTALVFVVVLNFSKILIDYANSKANSELNALLKGVPRKAHVLKGRKIVDVKASEVLAGDKIIINPGEIVPVDAIIIEGASTFDESSLTGESQPQSKSAKERVISGTINLDEIVTAQASHSAKDSQYNQVIRLIRSAAGSQAPLTKLAERYSILFTLSAFALAAAAWILSGNSLRFLQVIIVATPFPLLKAAPIAIISGLGKASKYGIIIKNSRVFERLAEAKTFAFDKTGILTKGVIEAEDAVAFSPFKKQEILVYAASLEQSSNHVLARAIVQAAKSKSLKLLKAKHVSEVAGRGLEAHISGKDIIVGHLSFMKDSSVAIPSQFKADKHEQTAVYVAVDGKLAGYVTFTDDLRPEAQITLSALRKFGAKHMLMVTEDNQTVADKIAKGLGIDNVIAEASPGDKLRAIDNHENRPLVFVGDGIIDAAALTAADIGIALCTSGNTAASESADIMIMRDSLGDLARAMSIARHTFKITMQSILIGIGISVALMLIFSTGKFPPILGAILQGVIIVIVTFNALRARNCKAL